MKYRNAIIAYIFTSLISTVLFFLGNILVQHSSFPPLRKHGFDNSIIDFFGVMAFYFSIISFVFFIFIFRTKQNNIYLQLLYALLITIILWAVLRLSTFGFDLKDSLTLIEILLFAISSASLPISFKLLSKIKSRTL